MSIQQRSSNRDKLEPYITLWVSKICLSCFRTPRPLVLLDFQLVLGKYLDLVIIVAADFVSRMVSRWFRSPKNVLATISALIGCALCYPVSDFALEIPQGGQKSGGCSPTAYADGKWTWDPKTNITEMTRREQAVEFGGFERCASDREFWWNLGSDNPEQFYRFPKAQSYTWQPGSECTNLRPMDPSGLVKDLVESGGWYFVGGLSIVVSFVTFA